MSEFAGRLSAVLGRIEYRGWTFSVGWDDDRAFMQITFAEIDPATGQSATWTSRKWRLSPHMTDSEIVQTALKAVLTAEEHEARERFMYRGRAIFGPHISVDALWDLVGRGELETRP